MPLKFPISLNIDACNACNLKCLMCFQDSYQFRKQTMAISLYKKIIENIPEENKLEIIYLHKDGEPLLNKELSKMIDFAKSKGISKRISFTTNGQLLTNDRVKEFVSAGLDSINISVDAFSPEIYALVKGRNMYKQLEKKIISLLQKNFNLEISLSFIVLEENKHELQSFKEQWKNAPVEIVVHKYHDWCGCNKKEGDFFFKNSINTTICDNPFYSLAVNVDGSASICCVDNGREAIVGNLGSSDLIEIWSGKRLENVRRALFRGNLSSLPCKNCHYKIEYRNNIYSSMRSNSKLKELYN